MRRLPARVLLARLTVCAALLLGCGDQMGGPDGGDTSACQLVGNYVFREIESGPVGDTGCGTPFFLDPTVRVTSELAAAEFFSFRDSACDGTLDIDRDSGECALEWNIECGFDVDGDGIVVFIETHVGRAVQNASGRLVGEEVITQMPLEEGPLVDCSSSYLVVMTPLPDR